MNCLLEQIKIDGDIITWKCSICKKEVVAKQGRKITSFCLPKQEPISIVQKAKNFSLSFANHVVDGMKKATPEQVAERLSICQQCPLFVATNTERSEGYCSHSKCGCNVSSRSDIFLNKLCFCSESCPLNKWKRCDEGD